MHVEFNDSCGVATCESPMSFTGSSGVSAKIILKFSLADVDGKLLIVACISPLCVFLCGTCFLFFSPRAVCSKCEQTEQSEDLLKALKLHQI